MYQRHRGHVRACLVRRAGVLFLQLADSTAGEYILPGGSIEPGESPIEALRRVVMEETGILVLRTQLVAMHIRSHCLDHYYLVTDSDFSGSMVLNCESICAVWLDPNLDHGPAGYPVIGRQLELARHAVDVYINKRRFSESLLEMHDAVNSVQLS